MLPELKESIFYKQDFRPVLVKIIEQLDTRAIERIICYGLGSFHNGTEVASRYQLALLLLIYDELVSFKAPIRNVIEIFDPSFEPKDLETLKTFSRVKFHIIDANEHCARKIEGHGHKHTTLVYMPHLDKHFYNNLLGTNWYVGCLDRLVVLGNSFRTMVEYETRTACRTKLYYINLLVNNFNLCDNRSVQRDGPRNRITNPEDSTEPRALIELLIESKDNEYWEIFNNFAFHYLSEPWLSANKYKIEQHRLVGWEKVISTDPDSEWHEN